jgi:hypothetical protein
MEKSNSHYTVLGFSKTSFGCCGRHSICQLGILNCAIEDRDPEAKDYCICYQRNHKPTKVIKPITRKDTKTEFQFSQEEDGQLSMF